MANAVFVQKYKTGVATATAALSGTAGFSVTGAVQLTTGGTGGSLVTRITAMPRASTTAASSLVLFLVKAASPNVFNMIDSEVMPIYTSSVNAAIPETNFPNISPTTPLRLESGDSLWVGSQVALGAGILFYSEQGDL